MDGSRGRIISVTAAPAAGADLDIQVPANKRWRIQTLVFRKTNSAAVANRSVIIHVLDAAGNECWAQRLETDAAGVQSFFFVGSQPQGAAADTTKHNFGDLPPNLELAAGEHIGTSVNGLQAGDQIDAVRLRVEEWDV